MTFFFLGILYYNYLSYKTLHHVFALIHAVEYEVSVLSSACCLHVHKSESVDLLMVDKA